MDNITIFFTDDEILKIIADGRLSEFLLLDWRHSHITTFVGHRLLLCLKRLWTEQLIEWRENTERGDWIITPKGGIFLSDNHPYQGNGGEV